MFYSLIFIPIGLALVYSAAIMLWLKKKPVHNAEMKAISNAIHEGSSAYLKRQYTSVAWVALILFIVIFFGLGTIPAFGFLVGAIASALAGLIGMQVAVRSNARTTEAAKEGLAPALSLAFKAGSVTGFQWTGICPV